MTDVTVEGANSRNLDETKKRTNELEKELEAAKNKWMEARVALKALQEDTIGTVSAEQLESAQAELDSKLAELQEIEKEACSWQKSFGKAEKPKEREGPFSA